MDKYRAMKIKWMLWLLLALQPICIKQVASRQYVSLRIFRHQFPTSLQLAETLIKSSHGHCIGTPGLPLAVDRGKDNIVRRLRRLSSTSLGLCIHLVVTMPIDSATVSIVQCTYPAESGLA